MARSLPVGIVAAALLASSAASFASGPAPTRASQTADFTPRGVSACLRRAQSSVGVVIVGENPYVARRIRARAVRQFTLMPSDYGLPGVTIAFASSRADTVRLQRAAVAFVRAEGWNPRTLVFRRRANVVFYYERSTLREIVRIANGCLGGPRYGGDGGTPPPPGIPG